MTDERVDRAADAVPAEPLLRLDQVHAYIGGSHILQGVTFDLLPGRVLVLLGRNGVGKTTTLRAILGLVATARGEITLAGASIARERPYRIVRRGVGYVPEDRDVFTRLTVAENLRLARRPGASPERLALVHRLFPDLERRAGQLAGTLSGGQQQMVAIARALVNDNRLLVIDEPSKGLAPAVVDQMTAALRAIKGETTILLVEQNLAVAQALGDDAAIIDAGRTVFHGAMAAVAADHDLQARYLGAGAHA